MLGILREAEEGSRPLSAGRSGAKGYSLRKYRPEDRDAVRAICADTALLGEPVDSFFRDRDITADILVSCYTDYEPESCFVAVSGGSVVGYLAGCVCPGRMRWRIAFGAGPVVVRKVFSRFVLFRKGALRVLVRMARALAGGEFFVPGFPAGCAASFHVNVDRRFRSSGAGTALVNAFLGYLREKKTGSVMIKTKSERAAVFFSRMGFKVLFSREISYLDAPGGGSVRLYIMARPVGREAGESENR